MRKQLLSGRNPAKGERHPGSKLTEDDVLEIVAAAECGEYTITSIARAYGISTTNVRAIISGKTWSWLTGINGGETFQKRS